MRNVIRITRSLMAKLLKRIFKNQTLALSNESKIIWIEYGHQNGGPFPIFGSDKQIVPWYTYPAIEYLLQFDLSNKSVFEWGSGGSSLFFSKRAKNVCSVENDSKWFENINKYKCKNLSLKLVVKEEDYAKSITVFNQKFDIIVIDAIQRFECASIACKFLNETGMIILDNSDWYRNTAKQLRNEGLIEIDMHGLGPLNSYTWTTSFFLTKQFDFRALNDFQPFRPIGGLNQSCE